MKIMIFYGIRKEANFFDAIASSYLKSNLKAADPTENKLEVNILESKRLEVE